MRKFRVTPVKAGYAKKFIKAHNKRITQGKGAIVVIPHISKKTRKR